MNKYNIINRNYSHNESDIEQDPKEPREQGGANITSLVNNQSTLPIIGNQNQRQSELLEAVVNIIIQYVAKALSFIISFIPSTIFMDHLTAQQSASQSKLRLSNGMKQRMKNCKHPAHKNLEKTALIRAIPTAHFEVMVQDDLKDKNLSKNDVAIASNSLNARIVDRLLEIDAKAPHHTELKLLNYQEWVDMLLKINKVLLRSMCELEAEFLYSVRESSIKNIESARLLKSYQADILRLMEFIRQAELEGSWNLSDFLFETFERSDIFANQNKSTQNYDM